jgi:hypothetical protein
MNDTSPRFEAMVAERHRQMTPEQRMRAAAAMFDTARTIVESSLPPGLSRYERRLTIARRMYGDGLPEAALAAHAAWKAETPSDAGSENDCPPEPSRCSPTHGSGRT